MNRDTEVIILGGGHNGLVAASYLAKAGMKVLLLERQPVVGGACMTEELFPGYRFSSCSYICHLFQNKIIEDLKLRKFGFEVYRLDPERFQPFLDGRRLLIWDDVSRTQEEISQFSTRDAERYPEWLAFWKQAAGLIQPYFLRQAPTITEVYERARRAGKEAFLDRLLVVSMTELVSEYFESEAMQGAFIQAQDVGDPGAVGSAWCYAYIKCNMFSRPENVGIVKGGMGGITQALLESALVEGVEVKLEMEVERILIKDGKACGVRLSSGEEIRSQIVVSNADPKRTFLKLVDKEKICTNFSLSLEKLKTESAYLKFHAALSGLPDFSSYFHGDLDPHVLGEIKICPSIEYYKRSWNDARHGFPAREPVMEVQIPSVYDSSLAPEGHHILSIWALYAPVKIQNGSWEKQRRDVGEGMIDLLCRYAPNFRSLIVDWSLFTPLDMEERVGLTDGNIRHLDMIPDQFLSKRPLSGWAHYRTPIPNLYLCGAGTHPGGEVTGAPGHNAAVTILQDWTNFEVKPCGKSNLGV